MSRKSGKQQAAVSPKYSPPLSQLSSLWYIVILLLLQNCIATHESNGIDIIIALILNDINPLGKKRMDLVLELKVSCAGGNEVKWNRFVTEVVTDLRELFFLLS